MTERAGSRRHVGLVYGGVSPEHEVSIDSARNVFSACLAAGFDVTAVYIDRLGEWRAHSGAAEFPGADSGERARTIHFSPAAKGGALTLVGDTTTTLDVDVFFPILHGRNGEDGRVQGLFQTLGVPFVGADIMASAACMDKDVTKRLLRDAGLPVVPFSVLRRGEPFSANAIFELLGATLFVKPANSGSSVGTARASTDAELSDAVADALRFDGKVLVETAIIGREIECAVLGNERLETAALGEIISTAEFYTYDSKYVDEDTSRMVVPADISGGVSALIRQMAETACRVLGVEGMARVDFFLTADDRVFINEINTIPGFTARSMYPLMWERSGLTNAALIARLVDLAMERYARDARLRVER